MSAAKAKQAGASAARSLQQGRGPPLDALELPPQAAAGASADDSRSFTPGSAKKVLSVGTLIKGPNKEKLARPEPNAQVARDSYVVAITPDTTPEDIEALINIARGQAATVQDLSGPAFQGFSIQAPPGLLKQAALLQELLESSKVSQISPDYIATVGQTTLRTQTAPPNWGLDRIDDPTGTDNSFTYRSFGTGVTAYIVDTGIMYQHTQFGSPTRASAGFDYEAGRAAPGSDCHGHGTHVAGIVGGTAVGVAKSVNLVSVRVLDCAAIGTSTSLIQGINWLTQHCSTTASQKCVANQSLSFNGIAADVEAAIQASIRQGVSYVVAAGNANTNACDVTPARMPEVVTVGASTQPSAAGVNPVVADSRASFSNFGPCVDLFAPGVNIMSSYYFASDPNLLGSGARLNGTSQAAPHVAGVAVQILSRSKTLLKPASVHATLVTDSTKNVIAAASLPAVAGAATPNRMLLARY